MSAQQESAITAARDEHVEAVNSTDVDSLLEGMTDDVVYLSPQAPPICGKVAMREFLAPLYAQAKIDITMEAESLEVSGGRAVEWGRAHGTLTLGEEAPQAVDLTYLLVYRLGADGRWRISHDISTPARGGERPVR